MTKMKTKCNGRLAYETMAGIFRLRHENGTYRFKCLACHHTGIAQGHERTHDEVKP